MLLRELIYSQSQGNEDYEDDEEELQQQQQTRQTQQEEQEQDEEAAATTTGLLEAAIWRRTMNRHRNAPESVKWRGLRPSRGAPLYHWPTSLLADCQNRPALMHLTLLQKLLSMCLAAQDVPGVATTLSLMQELQPRVDVPSLEANAWLLTQLAEREAAAAADDDEEGEDDLGTGMSTHGSQQQRGSSSSSEDPTSRPHARRLLMFLRNAMKSRIVLPPTAGDVGGEQPKAVAPPDYFRVLALSKLSSFLVSGGYLGYAQDLVRQEGFLRPFGTSPHVLAIRGLLPCLEAACLYVTREREEDEEEEEEEEEEEDGRRGRGGNGGLEAAFTQLVREPSKCFTTAGQPLSQQQQQQQQDMDIDAIMQDLDKALATGMAPSGVLAVRIGLLHLRATAKDQRAVLRAVRAHCQANPDCSRAQQLGFMAMRLVKGQDDKGTLGYLKKWVWLDPTAEEGLERLVHAYRRQLLRSYRDPTVAVLISRARLVHSLIDRLLTLPPPPSSSSSSSSSLHLHLKHFRWLATYLDPAPSTQEEEEEKPREEGEEEEENPTHTTENKVSSTDWSQRVNVQGVLAGRYEAWSPACRGLEESATLDLFDPAEVRGREGGREEGREDAFVYKWHEVLKESEEEEERRRGGRKRRKEMEELWAAVKYSRTGLHDKQEKDEGEEGGEKGQGANHRHNNNDDDEETESEDEDEEDDEVGVPKLFQHEKDDADDVLLRKICPKTDDNDNDPPLPAAAAAEEPLLLPSLRQFLLLLTYKAVVAAHFMGPRNPYTIFAIRRLWEITQQKASFSKSIAAPPALAPHLGRWLLFGKLRDVFKIDVHASLLLSDGYILAASQVQVPPHLSLLPMEEGRAREGPLKLGLAEGACGWPLPALYPPRDLTTGATAAAAAGGGGGERGGGGGAVFRPRSLPVATARATQVAIRKAFSKVKREREVENEEKEGKKKKKKKKQQKQEGGGGGGGGAGEGEEEGEGKEVGEEEEEGMDFEEDGE